MITRKQETREKQQEEGKIIINEWKMYLKPREDKGDREGIPNTHPIPKVIRLELFLESG